MSNPKNKFEILRSKTLVEKAFKDWGVARPCCEEFHQHLPIFTAAFYDMQDHKLN